MPATPSRTISTVPAYNAPPKRRLPKELPDEGPDPSSGPVRSDYGAAVRLTTLPAVAFQLLMQAASLPQRLAQRWRPTSRIAVSRMAWSAAVGSTLASLPGLPTVHWPVPVVHCSPIVSSSMMTCHHLSVWPLMAPSMKALLLSSSLFQVLRLAMVNDTEKPTGSVST